MATIACISIHPFQKCFPIFLYFFYVLLTQVLTNKVCLNWNKKKENIFNNLSEKKKQKENKVKLLLSASKKHKKIQNF